MTRSVAAFLFFLSAPSTTSGFRSAAFFGRTKFAPTHPAATSISLSRDRPLNGAAAAEAAAPQSSVSIATTTADLSRAAEFFVDNFWMPQASEGFEPTEQQRTGLVAQQLADFEERYGELMGTRRLSSALLLQEDDAGDVIGAVSIELTLINVQAEATVARKAAEAMFKERIGGLGPKQRRELKDFNIQDLCAELLSEEFEVLPVLSNLCVAASARRQGLGQSLYGAAANLVAMWGFFELWLQVEAANAPARRLYEGKLRFEEEWTDRGARALRIDEADPEGSFKEVAVPTITQSKFLARDF